MRSMQVATRYARALYNLAKDKNEQDAVFDQMRALADAIASDKEIVTYLNSRLIPTTEKSKVIEKLTAVFPFADTLKNFLRVLATKSRLPLFTEIVTAYQVIADEAHGVTRGVVRSATVLGPEERKRISELVSRATKKQVILTYKEDPSLLGGLVSEVGTYTFDDSLITHLKRMNEQLTRANA